LFESIESGKFPSWTVYIVRRLVILVTTANITSAYQQTMTPAQAEQFRYNILDLTKVWPHKEYPLREIGKIVLDENVQNYFAEIEQVRFGLQRRLSTDM
jgi:catalase